MSGGVGVGTSLRAYIRLTGSDPGCSVAGAASRPAPRRRCTWSQLRARPRAARTARPAARGPRTLCDRAPAGFPKRPAQPPVFQQSGTRSDALHHPPRSPYFFFRGFEAERVRLRRGDRSCGGRPSLEKVACPTPGGGGVGGRGKTMPRLRRGRRRQQARRAGCWGAGRLPRGAHRSEAPAFASPGSDAAGDRARFQQPPPPPGGPSKSLDLGEGAVLRGITGGAGGRPENP